MPTRVPIFKNGGISFRCSECHGPVDSTAKRCPHCCASFANEDIFGKWFLFFLLLLVALLVAALVIFSPGILLATCYGYFFEIDRTGFIISAVILSLIMYGLVFYYTSNPKPYCLLTAIGSVILYILFVINVDESKICSSFVRETVYDLRHPKSISNSDTDSVSEEKSWTDDSNVNETDYSDSEPEESTPDVYSYESNEDEYVDYDDGDDEEKSDEAQPVNEQSSAHDDDKTANEEPSRDDRIYDTVDQMPSFPGGQAGLMRYLSSNVKYPGIAEENGIQGRVTVQFVVETDGSITNVKTMNSVDPSLDKEAERVVRTMPRWKPGYAKGKAVRVKYFVPVVFRLQ